MRRVLQEGGDSSSAGSALPCRGVCGAPSAHGFSCGTSPGRCPGLVCGCAFGAQCRRVRAGIRQIPGEHKRNACATGIQWSGRGFVRHLMGEEALEETDAVDEVGGYDAEPGEKPGPGADVKSG